MIRATRLPLVCSAFFGLLLAFTPDAKALSIGDSRELGFLWPGTQSGNQDRVAYVNHMAGMALGSTDIANGLIYTRSNNAFDPLPRGMLPKAVLALNGAGTTINVGNGTLYDYLFVKYHSFGSVVWYVGNLSGSVTIPGDGEPLVWTLFGRGNPRVQVPDGGATIMLFGAALAALALARRRSALR